MNIQDLIEMNQDWKEITELFKVHFENILPQEKHNFEILSFNTNDQLSNYDYGSIMHYPADAFANAHGLITIEPLKVQPEDIGQRVGPSQVDLQAIKKLYNI